jgi:hypothetical protein
MRLSLKNFIFCGAAVALAAGCAGTGSPTSAAPSSSNTVKSASRSLNPAPQLTMPVDLLAQSQQLPYETFAARWMDGWKNFPEPTIGATVMRERLFPGYTEPQLLEEVKVILSTFETYCKNRNGQASSKRQVPSGLTGQSFLKVVGFCADTEAAPSSPKHYLGALHFDMFKYKDGYRLIVWHYSASAATELLSERYARKVEAENADRRSKALVECRKHMKPGDRVRVAQDFFMLIELKPPLARLQNDYGQREEKWYRIDEVNCL